MDVVVVAVFVTMVLGAPQGIILSLAVALIAAAVRSRGTLRERARGILRTRFLWASVAFSLAAVVLEDWQTVAIVWLIAAFIITAWRWKGAATDHDRAGLVERFVAALAGLAMAWLHINWIATPTAAWLLAVALLASGVFGVALGWPALPWFAGLRSRARTLGLVANLAMCTLIIAVPFI
jgi:hypothetical protein